MAKGLANLIRKGLTKAAHDLENARIVGAVRAGSGGDPGTTVLT